MLAFSPIAGAPIAEADGFVITASLALAATDAKDTSSVSVSVSISAPYLILSATDAKDTASVSVSIRTGLDATEAPDTALMSLFCGNDTNFAITDAPDIAALEMNALWGVLLTPDTPIWDLVD